MWNFEPWTTSTATAVNDSNSTLDENPLIGFHLALFCTYYIFAYVPDKERGPSVWDVDVMTPNSFDVVLEIDHFALVIQSPRWSGDQRVSGDLVIGELDWHEVWYPETAGLKAYSLPLAVGN